MEAKRPTVGQSNPGVYPVFRPDLEVIRQAKRGKPTSRFLLKDHKEHHEPQIFEMEEEEYFICQQLDGQTPLATIQASYESRFGTPLSIEDLKAFVHQLDFQGLLVSSMTDKAMIRFWDPEHGIIVSRRVPLYNPDPLLTWCSRHLWWCFNGTFVLSSFAVIVLGLYLSITHWTQLTDALYMIWQPQYFPVLIPVGIFCVTLPHEFAHGLVSTHYGGRVTSAGWLIFYHVLPKFYLERRQTLAIPFLNRNKTQFFWILFVGLYCQLFLASLGIIGVLLTIPEGYAYYFWAALWATAAIGFVHNCNISHRRDAHYLLVIWLDMPNLRTRAVEVVLNWLFRRPEPEPLTPRERNVFRLYGLGAMSYYLIHGFIMFWTFGDQITTYLQGPGVFVFIGIVLYVFQRPLITYAREPVKWLTASEAPAIKRWIVRLGWFIAIVGVSLVPYPYETGGPFTVLPAVQMEVHCEIDGGRIEQVYVREGDSVAAGQPIGQIDRREYEKNLQATQAQLDNTKAQLQLLRKQLAILTQPPNIEQIIGMEAEVRRLEALVTDYRKQLVLTTLRSQIAGRIITPLIDQKVGQYLKKGDLFATIEQVQAVQVEIQVPESDGPMVRVGSPIKVVPWAYPNESFHGSVKEIAPIAAMPTSASTVKVNSIRVLAEIPNPDLRLKAQITGFAKIKADRMPVWRVLSRLLIRWFQVQFWYWLP